MEDCFLRLENVSKSYGESTAVEGISLGLYKGRTVGIFGQKGAGKSTLGRLMAGIEAPDGGKITLDGKKLNKKAKKRISYLIDAEYVKGFKQFSRLFEFYEVFYPDFDRKKALELLRLFEVDPEKKLGANKGDLQLGALAVLAARKAELYILDEPLDYFDRNEREEYLKTALKTLEGEPLAVILAEHLRGLGGLAEDVVFLHNGRVKLCKTAAEIRQRTGKSVEDLYKEAFLNGTL